jgi:hypothetical protein
MKKAKCFTNCLISYILASNLLDEIFQLLRNKLNKKPPYRYEISPFLKRLLTTSNLRTLDFSRTKTDIHSLAMQSNILHQATIKSPVIDKLKHKIFFNFEKFLLSEI